MFLLKFNDTEEFLPKMLKDTLPCFLSEYSQALHQAKEVIV